MKRTYIAVLLALGVLTACGKSASSAEPASDTAGAEKTTAQGTPEAAPALAEAEPAAPAPSAERALPTVAVVVTHRVKDFDAWKKAFEEHQAAREEAGIVAHHVNRGVADPSLVLVYLVGTDVEKLKAFTTDPALKAAMKSAGVIGKPTIEILTPVENHTSTDATLPAALVVHDVKDYDAWKTIFDGDSQVRTDAGLVGYSLNRGEKNANRVTLYAQGKSREALEAFLASPDLKAKMKTAGVKGKPTVTVVQGVEWNQYRK